MKKQGYLYDRDVVKKFEYQEETLRKICKYTTLKKLLQYENELKKYRQKKYRVCIFQSEKEDIKNNFLQLIENNLI